MMVMQETTIEPVVTLHHLWHCTKCGAVFIPVRLSADEETGCPVCT